MLCMYCADTHTHSQCCKLLRKIRASLEGGRKKICSHQFTVCLLMLITFSRQKCKRWSSGYKMWANRFFIFSDESVRTRNTEWVIHKQSSSSSTTSFFSDVAHHPTDYNNINTYVNKSMWMVVGYTLFLPIDKQKCCTSRYMCDVEFCVFYMYKSICM